MNKRALAAAAFTLSVLYASDTPMITPNELIPALEASNIPILHDQPICFLFAHGLGGTRNNVHYYHKHNIVRQPFFSFNFPDAFEGVINYKETSLAQENEIAAFKDAFDDVCQEIEYQTGRTPQIVLTGVSRGASSIITFMATHNPQNVCALVLESPFDAVHSIIRGILKKVGISHAERLEKFVHSLATKPYKKYDRFAPTPLDMIPFIQNKDLPILIICSKKDELIPWDSSYRLHEEFKKHNFTNVHIFVSSHGKHVRILEDRCANLYKQAADTFYQRYLNI